VERFVRGDIIIIEFPYSHLKETKRRPVLILKIPHGDDIIVLQMTGSSYEKQTEVLVKREDFRQGGLKREGYVRIDKVASIEKSLIMYKAGSLRQEKFNEILERFCSFVKG